MNIVCNNQDCYYKLFTPYISDSCVRICNTNSNMFVVGCRLGSDPVCKIHEQDLKVWLW